eukprot:763930-Hanusia_phi.AAC.14
MSPSSKCTSSRQPRHRPRRVLGKLLDIFLLGVAREIPALEPTTVSGAVLCLASAAYGEQRLDQSVALSTAQLTKHVLRVLKVALLDFALQGDLEQNHGDVYREGGCLHTTLLLLLLLLDQPLGSLSLLGALLWKLLGQDVVDLTQPAAAPQPRQLVSCSPLKEFCLFFPQLGQLLIRILLTSIPVSSKSFNIHPKRDLFLLFLVRPFIFIRLLLNLNVVLVSIFCSKSLRPPNNSLAASIPQSSRSLILSKAGPVLGTAFVRCRWSAANPLNKRINSLRPNPMRNIHNQIHSTRVYHDKHASDTTVGVPPQPDQEHRKLSFVKFDPISIHPLPMASCTTTLLL